MITLSVHISHWLFTRPDGCDERPLSLMQCQVTSQESVKVLRCTLEVGHHTSWGLMLTRLELLDIILAGMWAGNSYYEWDLCHDASMFENGCWCSDSSECEWEWLEGWLLSGWTWFWFVYLCVVCIFLLVVMEVEDGDWFYVRACVYVCLHAADGSGQTAASRHQCVACVAVVTLFSGIVSGWPLNVRVSGSSCGICWLTQWPHNPSTYLCQGTSHKHERRKEMWDVKNHVQ